MLKPNIGQTPKQVPFPISGKDCGIGSKLGGKIKPERACISVFMVLSLKSHTL